MLKHWYASAAVDLQEDDRRVVDELDNLACALWFLWKVTKPTSNLGINRVPFLALRGFQKGTSTLP